MLVALIEAQRARPRDVSSLRLAGSGGSMVPPELIREVRSVFRTEFQTVYGQTESSPPADSDPVGLTLRSMSKPPSARPCRRPKSPFSTPHTNAVYADRRRGRDLRPGLLRDAGLQRQSGRHRQGH